MKRLIFLTIIFLVSVTSAQTQKPNPAEIKKQKEELLEKKEKLLKEKVKLDKVVGELTKEFVILDKQKTEDCREYYLKKYGNKIGFQISNRQVWKGMTEEMFVESQGKPDKKNTNKQKWGTFSQYYYGNTIYFFKDGSLTDWEEK